VGEVEPAGAHFGQRDHHVLEHRELVEQVHELERAGDAYKDTLVSPPASFDSLRLMIHERFEQLSPHLQRIARSAFDDPNAFALGTGIAESAEVQPSSIIRFAQSFGYRGFSEMQQIFKVRLIEGAPSFREQILAERAHPLQLLHEFADANAQALERLKHEIRPDGLERPIAMIHAARDIYVISLRRAFPIAAYIFYGLVREELRAHLLDAVGGMVPQQVATMTGSDLLIAVSFAEYAPLNVDVVQDVHIRGIPTLTITEFKVSPLARNAALSFVIRDPEIHPFRSLGPAVCLVRPLIVGLGRFR
jgi:DNA-binding MurR/RpiR family transcriptional regulator